MKKYLYAVAFTLSLVIAPVIAQAQLSDVQRNAIITILQEFGADAQVLNDVNVALGGIGSIAPVLQIAPTENVPSVASSVSCIDLPNKALYLRSRGAEVTHLQEFLKSKGYLSGYDATGFYGTATQDAVRAFQRAEGIVSSGTPGTTGYGVVGPSTRERIKALTCREGVEITHKRPVLASVVIETPGSRASGSMVTVRGYNLVDTSPSSISVEFRQHGFLKSTINASELDISSDGTVLSFKLPEHMTESTNSGTYNLSVMSDNGRSNGMPLFIAPSNAFTGSSITVLSPNDEMTWTSGNSYTIRWTGDAPGNVTAYFYPYPSGGVRCKIGSTAVSNGSMSFYLTERFPCTNGQLMSNGKYYIKLHTTNVNGYGFDPNAEWGASDASDKPVTIRGLAQENETQAPAVEKQVENNEKEVEVDSATGTSQPSITILSPNGSETYHLGDKLSVLWNSSGITSSTLDRIQLRRIDIDRVTPLYYSPTNDGNQEVTLPLVGGLNVKYVIEVKAIQNGQVITAQSEPFIIAESPSSDQPTITVLSPNGGETFAIGQPVTIRWSSKDIASNLLHIGLIGPDGTSVARVEPHADKHKGSFIWSIFTGLTPGQYKVTITDPNNFNITDSSDSYFTITSPVSTAGKPLVCGSLGDVDNDGRITEADVEMARGHILNSSLISADAVARADVNGSNSLSTLDTLLMQAYLNGSSTTFPGCTTDTTTAEPFSIASARLVDGKLMLTYSKDFTTCAHVLRAGSYSPIASACSNGTNVTQSFSGNAWSVGDTLRLCHGNNYGQCTNTVTITSGESASRQSNTASAFDGFRVWLESIF